VMAAQSGLSSGFVGATLLAVASSLPEVSTTVAATREGNEALAVSNVFGSNSFDVALLAVVSMMAADAFGRGPLESTVFMASLGAVLTCLYLWGLLARAQRSVGRVGVDSIAVVVIYLAGMGALYGLG
jgi:cation:H+ antiporter